MQTPHEGAFVFGGDGRIRTVDARFCAHAPLAGEFLRPLGHVSRTSGRKTPRGTQPARNGSLVADGLASKCQAGACSRPNALCNARTANSMYLSSTTTEILISLVEIIWMLMPSSESVRNIRLAMPTCERMPMPTTETLAIFGSPTICFAPIWSLTFV